MKHLAPALLLTTALLTACGGDKTSGNSGNNPGNTSPDVTTRLTSCGAGSSMNGCLAGSYSGQTPSGESCTVTIKADGGYTFAAPKLNYTYATTAQTAQTYSHSVSSGQHTLNWAETDPNGTKLQLSSTFGTGVAAPLADLTGTSGGQSETCRVTLTATPTPGGDTGGDASTLTRVSGQVYDELDSSNPAVAQAIPWSGGAQAVTLKVLDGAQNMVPVATGTVNASGQLSLDLPATVTLSQWPSKPTSTDPNTKCSDNLKVSDTNGKGVLGLLITADGTHIGALNDSVTLGNLYPNGTTDGVLLQYSDRAVTITGDQTCTVTIGGIAITTTIHNNLAFKKGWNLMRDKRWVVSADATSQVYEINQTSITTVPAHWLSSKVTYGP